MNTSITRNIISRCKLEIDKDFIYKNLSIMKPDGVWYGLNDEWLEFILEADFTDYDEKTHVVNNVSINSDKFTKELSKSKDNFDKILAIDNIEDFLHLTKNINIYLKTRHLL